MRGRRYGYFARKERRKARRRRLGRWRVLRNNEAFNPHLRQLLHVGCKIAAKLGDRHLKPLFFQNG